MLNILIIDDEPDFLELAEDLLSEHIGLKLFTAINSEAAKKIYDEQTLDLIICDQNLRGEKGTDILRILKEKQPKAFRVLISGDDLKDTPEVIELDLYKVLLKPFNVSQLEELVVNDFLTQDDIDKMI